MTPDQDLSTLRIDRAPTRSSGGSRPGLIAVFAAVGLAAAALLYFLLLRTGARPIEVELGSVEATGGGTATGDGITANGYVVARTKASVSSKILGRLSWVGITEGSHVREGEIIARIESADFEAAAAAARATVAQLQAQVLQAKRDLDRAKSLRAQNLLADAA